MTPLKLTNFVWTLFLFCYLSKNSYAGITIEPFIGAEGGTWKSEEAFPLNDSDVSGTQRGVSYGLYYGSRAYFGILKALFIGAGYYQTKSQWNISDDDDVDEDNTWMAVTAERKSLNLFFGLQKPGSAGPLYKLWFSFSPLETLTLSKPHQPTHPTQSPITYSGSSLSGGYSMPLKGWFYLNLEYSVISMNKRTQNGSEYKIPSSANFQTYTSFTFNTFLASISMPVTFLKKKLGW